VWYLASIVTPADPATGAPVMRTATVQRAPLEATIRLSGMTTAERFATLLAPQLGGNRNRGGGPSEYHLILSSIVDGGSRVRAGDIVAEFDRQYMLTRMDDYQSMLLQHQLSVRRSRAVLDIRRKALDQRILVARGTLDKAALELRKAPVLSAMQTERLRLNHEEAKARYDQLLHERTHFDASERASVRFSELDLREATLEFRRAETNLAQLTARAPISGIVVLQTTRRGSETAQIKEGDQIYPGQPYIRIVDAGAMRVTAMANQADVELLQTGAAARVRFEAFPDLELSARVSNIGAHAQGGGWRRAWVANVPVRLTLEETDPRVVPDLTASVDVVLARQEDALTVPRECIFRDSPSEESYVIVRSPEGWEKRVVEVGATNHTTAAVGGELREGEIVAAELPGHAGFSPGR
jgi:multidrug efflux pump subunit AcrA (membrane-fusion protein)